MHKSNMTTKAPTRMFQVYHRVVILLATTFLPLVLFTLFFARLFTQEPSIFMIPDFGESDVLHFNLPLKTFLSQSLKQRRWPMWSPQIASGFPVLAEGQIGTFFLPNLILFRFLPFVTAYNGGLVIAYVTAFVGCMLLYRKLGFSQVVANLCALVFTFSGFFSVHLAHYNFIQAATIFPLVVWSALKVRSHPSIPTVSFFAFILAQQVFAGYLGIVFVTLVGIFILHISLEFVQKTPINLVMKRSIILTCGVFLAVTLASIQLFPTFELWQRSVRSMGQDFATTTAYPYPWRHLVTFISPYFFGTPADGTYPLFRENWGIFWENTAYIGIIPLLMALIGAIVGKKKKITVAILLLLGVSVLLITGKYSPIYPIFSFPPFSMFRVPSRFLLITLFSLVTLTGIGLTHLNRYENRLKREIRKLRIYHILIPVGIVIFVLDGYLFSYHYPPVSQAAQWLNQPTIAQFVQRQAKVASIGASQQWNDVFLKRGWQDMRPFVFFKNNLFPNLNVLYDISHVDFNTGGLYPRRMAYFASFTKQVTYDDEQKIATLSAQAKNAISLAAVTHIISPYSIADNLTRINTISDAFPEDTSIHVFELSNSRPRAYLVNSTKKVSTVEEIALVFSDPQFLSKYQVLVEEDHLLLETPLASLKPASVLYEDNDSLTIDVNVADSQLLVVSDTKYPGWKATVDGVPTPIETVNLIQRGVIVSAGHHIVEFKFFPSTFETGKKITVTTMIGSFVLVLLSRLRRGSRS